MKQEEVYYHQCLVDIIHQIEANISAPTILSQIEKIKIKLEQEGNKGIGILVDSFLDAFCTRIKSADKDSEHIYLKTFETPQIILFKTLIQNFPPVARTQKTIVNFIAQKVKTLKKVTILDVGIGTGQQIVSILKEIQAMNPNIEEVTIVGIEPSLDSIKIAQKNLSACTTKNLNVKVVLLHEFAEQMDVATIKKLIPPTSESFIINASFALHHIKTMKDRQVVLGKLKALQPDFLLLTEPNIDHYTSDLMQRFDNCFHHFKVNFAIIDAQPLKSIEQEGLKHFFCREIKDIMGHSESDRVEKHSPAKEWLTMLKKASFNPIKIKTQNTLDKDFKWHKEGYLGFGTEKETLIGVVAVE